MRVLVGIAIGLTALTATVVLGSAQVEFDPSADFSAYRTYAWRTGTEARRLEAQKRIVDAVERGLASKGLTRVEKKPDVYVETHALVGQHTSRELADPTYWKFVTGVTSVDAFDVRGGTLVVDLIDAGTLARVWRGVVSKPVKGNPGKALKKIDSAVQSVLAHFPPD
jgi:hypothetical protein